MGAADLIDLEFPQFPLSYSEGTDNIDLLLSVKQNKDFFAFQNYKGPGGAYVDIDDIPAAERPLYSISSALAWIPKNCLLESSFVLPKVAAPIIAAVGAKQ